MSVAGVRVVKFGRDKLPVNKSDDADDGGDDDYDDVCRYSSE